jgi:hypothetical protein
MGNRTYIADKETLDKVYNILAADEVYGFIEHMNVLSPTERIEYIGANAGYTPLTVNKTAGEANYGSWANFPILVGNKPWMVRSDGTPDYRLDETDYTKKEDGTASDVANTAYDGGAFAWIPKIYKQEYMLGNDRVVKFSMSKRDGFEAVGFIDPDNKELEGVWIPMFYGSIVDTKMKSISGVQPCYSNATAAEKTAIDAFGERAKFFGGPIVQTLTDLLIMFGKSTNSQAVYGNGNMSGYDTSLAPTNGVKQNAVVGGGQFYGTSDGKSLNKILHSIVLGTWQQWMRDPYTLLVNGRYKVSKNYAYDLTGATYHDTGISLPKVLKEDGSQNTGIFYPHKYQTVPGFGAVPVHPCKGSTSTGGCDGLWQNVEITAVALRFGLCTHGTIDGLRSLTVGGTASFAHWGFGAAILLLPPVGVAA